MTSSTHSAHRCAVEVNAVLLEPYLEVLEQHDLVTIAQSEKPGVLSGLFLPTVDDAYRVSGSFISSYMAACAPSSRRTITRSSGGIYSA